MSYDPTDCELGICGPCESCQEQMKIDGTPESFTGEEPGEFVELGGRIPEAQVNASKKTLIGTIDLRPSWHSIVGFYLEMLERPEFQTGDRRQGMKDEILRAAKLADLYAKEHKQ